MVKRIYSLTNEGDGFRVLVNRLWPRGLSKKDARVDLRLKDIAPSDGLRRWFGHEPAKWEEFKRRYFAELDGKRDLLKKTIMGERERGRGRHYHLLYAAKDGRHNNAVALAEYMAERVHSSGSNRRVKRFNC